MSLRTIMTKWVIKPMYYLKIYPQKLFNYNTMYF